MNEGRNPFWTWPEPRMRDDGTVEYRPDDVGDIHRPPLEHGCQVNDCYHARGEPIPEALVRAAEKERVKERMERDLETLWNLPSPGEQDENEAPKRNIQEGYPNRPFSPLDEY